MTHAYFNHVTNPQKLCSFITPHLHLKQRIEKKNVHISIIFLFGSYKKVFCVK